MHIHFIGICGTFMAGLARIACDFGHKVTGSDRNFYPPMSDQLIEMGVETYCGFGAEIWDEITPNLVIVGNVCSRGMPIIEEMLTRGFDYASGPKWLGEQLLKDKYVFAIAGTHGKTTTTAMLVHILRDNAIDPGYLVGGVVPSLTCSAHIGTSQYFVIEADEYDCAYFDKRPKLIHYQPNTLIIGNVEFDHADIYEHVGQIVNQFHYGVRLVPPSGTVIFGQGKHVNNVRDKGVWSNVIDLNSADYQLEGNNIMKGNISEGLLPDNLVGTHNLTNAMIACLAAKQAGLSISESCKSLQSFSGVKRRLELIADIGGIRVYDDFAHHPTAIEMTLTAMQKKYPDKRIISVFEPRSNTMQQGIHDKVLGNVLALADKSYVYWAEELSWELCNINEHILEYDVDRLCLRLLEELRSGDEVIIMSNGIFCGLHKQLVNGLKEKYGNEKIV